MSFICHIHNYTEYNSSEMCSLHLTYPSAHTLGASGQPTLRRPGSSWRFVALLKGLTSVVDNSCRSRDSNPQPWVTSSTLYPLEPWLPIKEEFTTWNRTPISSTGGDSSTTELPGWDINTQIAFSTIWMSQETEWGQCGWEQQVNNLSQ